MNEIEQANMRLNGEVRAYQRRLDEEGKRGAEAEQRAVEAEERIKELQAELLSLRKSDAVKDSWHRHCQWLTGKKHELEKMLYDVRRQLDVTNKMLADVEAHSSSKHSCTIECLGSDCES